jgi:ABC-type sugar transport system ATPase subunit
LDRIRLEGITKSLNGNVILKDVNLSLEHNEIRVILGPSGSGKTSILNIISGIMLPDSGRVLKDGKDITYDKIEERRVGFVFQDLGLFYSMTVAENIAYGLKLKKKGINEINEKVKEISDFFGIRDQLLKYPSQLSGGERQLVALSRTLVNEPDLLLMDEPLSSLDSFLRGSIRWYIRDIPARFGVSVIYVTHDMADAEILGDSIAVLNEGTIIQDGPKADVLAGPRNSTVAKILGYNVFEVDGKKFAIRPENFVNGGDIRFKIIYAEKGFHNHYLIDTHMGRFYVISSKEIFEEDGLSLKNAIPLSD